MPNRWLLVLLLALPTTRAAAQPAAGPAPGASAVPYVYDGWGTDDGLPHTSVSALHQTRDGYLWVGTAAGLVRFNAHRFTPAADAAPHLGHAYIWTFHEDPDGALWVGAGGGLTRMNAAGAVTFTTADGLPVSFVRAVTRDRAGTLWAGTYGGGLCRLVGEAFSCTAEGLAGPFVTALRPGRDGVLWVGTDGGLAVRRAGRLLPVEAAAGLRDVRTLHEAADGTLWIGAGAGLYRLRGDTLTDVLAGGRPAGTVHALAEDAEARLWVGTEDHGLYLVEDDALVRPVLDAPLAPESVRALLRDREGGLWAGTHGEGLVRLKPGRARVYGTPEGLAGDVTTTVLETRDGAVWTGTENGLTRLRGDVATSFGRADGLPTDRVLSLAERADGTLWVGTDGGGLVRYDGGAFTPFADDEALRDDAVYALYVDAADRLWVGTNRGLRRIERGAVTTFTTADGLAPGIVTAFAVGADGALWVGADGGLSRYDDGAFTTFTTADGLPTDLVRALHVDARGVLWIGTRGGGLVRLRDGVFTTFTTRHGLPDDLIYGLLEDDLGHLWLSTGRRGLVRVPKAALDAVARGEAAAVPSLVVDRGDGLRSAEMNGGYHPSGWKARDGRLWFPSHDGVVVVDPRTVDPDAPPPPIRIEAVRIDEQPVPFAAGAVTLPASARRLAIHYASLSFRDPDRTRFRYRLDDADAGWTTTTQWSREYLQLQPGTYTFSVAAANADGTWSTTPATLLINVEPPLWRTWWAYGVYALLAGFALSALIRWRILDLRRRNEVLEALVAERTAQVAAQAARLQEMDTVKSRFFANLSHEFRTPLTLILGPLDDALRTSDPPDHDALGVMQRQARRLLRLIDQLLDLAKLEAGRLHLHARRLDLVPLLDDVVASFAPAAEARGIALDFQPTRDRIDVYAEREKLEHVFYNLLTNALKFTEPGGKVYVTAAPTDDGRAVDVAVRDTGSGIPPDELGRIFDRFHQSAAGGLKGTGIGLALVRELVGLHGGRVWAESDVGFGSTFTVHLPLGRAHLRPADLADEPADAPPPLVDMPAPPVDELAPDDPAEAAPAGEPATSPAGAEAPLVLVVEDDADVRAYLRRCLLPTFRVVMAEDGAEGLARARAAAPALVISDVRMPVMDGFELARRLKADPDLRHVPLILLTARASDEARLAGLDAGADDYLAKPFNPEELRARARNLVAARQQLREQFSGEVVLRPSGVVVPSAEAAFLERAVQVVEAHLGDNRFGVGMLADAVGLSARQLQRRLRDLTGESPSHFIRRIRLERAAQLLAQRAATVSEVAYAVGFNKPAYFSKLFAATYGVPPSEYAPDPNEVRGEG